MAVFRKKHGNFVRKGKSKKKNVAPRKYRPEHQPKHTPKYENRNR